MKRNGVPMGHNSLARMEKHQFLKLWKSMKEDGFVRQNVGNNINVAVGRDGRLWALDGGTHRLAICYALGIPMHVDVLIRHPGWVAFRRGLRGEKNRKGSTIPYYTALPHPDLESLPHRYGSERERAIAKHIAPGARTVLDLGCRYGSMSHYLNDLGYRCVGVEGDPAVFALGERLHKAMRRKGRYKLGNVLSERTWNADVLLGVNIFRYIHNEPACARLLRNSKIGQIFVVTNNRRIPKRFHGSMRAVAEWVAEQARKSSVVEIGSDGKRTNYMIS